MSCKYFITLISLFFLVGCAKDEARPVIDTSRPILPPKTQWTPPAVKPSPTPRGPASWIPPKWIERKWETIVIHHSATVSGNAAIFDQEHKDKGWEGVGYDFVIGNGAGSGDGAVEVTFRWKEQKTGAHCGGTPGNVGNTKGIGICLVGDFNIKSPTQRQMQSLKQLVSFLQKRYGIPKSKIYGHGSFPGGHATDCPGRNFPMWQLKK